MLHWVMELLLLLLARLRLLLDLLLLAQLAILQLLGIQLGEPALLLLGPEVARGQRPVLLATQHCDSALAWVDSSLEVHWVLLQGLAFLEAVQIEETALASGMLLH